MKKFLVKLVLNIENYKIYHIIILFTTVFIILFMNGFYHIREELKFIANQNRILITKEIDFTISSWFSARINHLENSARYMEINGILDNEQMLTSLIKVLINNHQYFDAIHTLVPDQYFYFNEKKSHNYHDNPVYIHKDS